MDSDRPDVSRRGFIASTSAVALAVGAGVGGGVGYALGQRSVRRGPSERAWRELSHSLLGPVVRPWDASFTRTVLPNNLRYAGIIPEGVARCLRDEDVAQAVRWCREHGMPLTIRSGGHSYAGFSTTTGLMIDMTLMNGVAFDEASGTVRMEGGVLNSAVYTALREHNVSITHGRCPSVGASAFLLGGGIGFNMRENGLACDQVTASEMVTAGGKLLRMSATQNDALFWACRGGGGGNFGVSTSFTMQTFAVPEKITVFQIKWSADPEKAANALAEALNKAPLTLGSRMTLSAVTKAQQAAGQDVVVGLLGQYKGPQSELLEILAPVGPPSSSTIYEMTYWQGQDFLHEDQPPVFYQERSAFVNRTLDAAALAVGFKHLREWPGTGEYCDLRFFQTGGKMNVVPPRDTAFVHRASSWLMVVGLYWNEADNRDRGRMVRNHEWQDAFYHAMLPFCGGGAYQNFPDPSLKDWRRSYYGENFDRLARIKKDIDPKDVFTFAQAV